MKILLAAPVLALLCACATPPSPESQQLAAATDPSQELTCQRDKVMGQIKPVKICHTAEEWEQIRTAGLETAREGDRSLRQTSNQSQ